MKLILDSAELTAALRLVASRVPVRPAVPVLSGVKLTASGETLTLAAYDFSVSARADVPAAVREAGTVVVPGRALRDLARTLPKDGAVDLTVEFGRAHLAFGAARVSIPVLPADEYPTLPVPAPASASLSGRDLAAAVRQVATAAGKDETLPILTGLRLELSGRFLKLAATDRYRIAYLELPVTRNGRRHPQPVVVPAKQLADTAWALRHAQNVSLALPGTEDQPLTLSGGNTAFTHKPLENSSLFPRIATIVPTEFATTITVERRPLVDALNRIQLVGERHVPVHLHADPAGQLLIRSGYGDTTQLTDRIDGCTVTGEDMRIAFNPLFLLEGLRGLKCRTVQVNLVSPRKSALLHDAAADRTALRYLQMPIRIEEGAAVSN